MENNNFTGVWVPRDVYLARDVPWSAKIIFIEVHSFTMQGKPCFMSNEHLAEFCNISTFQVSRYITLLKQKGWLELVSFDGKTRVLRSLINEGCAIPQSSIAENRKAALRKTAKQSRQKPQSSIAENRKHTNTTTNTTTNTIDILKTGFPVFTKIYFDFYFDFYKTKPIFTNVDGVKLKEIIKKLEIKNRETSTVWSQTRAELLLTHFLKTAARDKWLKQNFLLKNLDSQFNSIINKTATNAAQPTNTPFDK